MPLYPIDLQVMFSQVEHISKTQSMQKEVPVSQQMAQGSQITDQSIQETRSVPKSKDIESGLNSVQDATKESANNKKQKDPAKKNKHLTAEGSQEKTDAMKTLQKDFADPQVGNNIDVLI